MTPVDPTSRSRVWAVVLCALAVRLAYMGVFALPERLPEQSYAWDWGYEQVPGDVSLAQAKLTAAQLLAEAAGETISAERVALGDWAVTYATADRPGGPG